MNEIASSNQLTVAAAGSSSEKANGALFSILARVERTIEEETNAFRTNRDFDIGAFNARKSRCLYELNRAIKDMGTSDLDGALETGLVRLKRKLEENETVIRAHITAVTEVAVLLRDTIERSEADGTYSANEFGAVKEA
ncbi:hypothetical protein [Limoniibacter endophyticus]|uniref:Flagellar protein FlgN n=1 Tax=Limoniibacter endophyticus TaxID=1565040 RepID=A0A8J3DMP4_9HYPH|nr:hypothetical protein [Limoniibacter endophyticus]GHC64428.1 hypothetical protein GCM10010136_06370 [Limoniibacter endophyticus]